MNLPNNIGEAVMQKRKFESRESNDFEWAIPLDLFLPIIVALVYAVIVLVSLL
jgi:hypothetical protein